MFDDEFEEARGSVALLGELVARTESAERAAGCRILVLAAAWADRFTDPDELPERDSDGGWHQPTADSTESGQGAVQAAASGASQAGDAGNSARNGAGSRGDGSAAGAGSAAGRGCGGSDDGDNVESLFGPRRPRRPKAGPGTEGFIRPGGIGTPWIAECCPAELGLLLSRSPGSARVLIGEALDLRHRHPRLWTRILGGQVHAWKARTIAWRSRYLNVRAVDELDRLISHQIELVSWGRFENILDATLLHVDQAAYHARRAEAQQKRGVWGGESEAGIRTIIIRACQGDAAVFEAAVNRIADLLADEGDEDLLNVRKSKAVGIIANPAAALDLLNRHAAQLEAADEPWDYEPDPTGTDPWDQAPPAGWATARYANYHQPDPADPDYQAGQRPPADPEPAEPDQPDQSRLRNEPGLHDREADRTDRADADPRATSDDSADDDALDESAETAPRDGEVEGTARATTQPCETGYTDEVGDCQSFPSAVDPVAPDPANDTSDQRPNAVTPDPVGPVAEAPEHPSPEHPSPEHQSLEHPSPEHPELGAPDPEAPDQSRHNPGAQPRPPGASQRHATTDATADESTVRRPLLPDGGIPLRPVTRADRNASRPRVTIMFHLTDQAIRTRDGIVRTDAGPITLDELRQFLTDTDANITIRPVFDPASVAPVDCYEIPPDQRSAIELRHPTSVFPFTTSTATTASRTDVDHTRPYRRGGPPGQTNLGNLGPLSRTEHRAKTVGNWTVRQPDPGTYLWRSPHGWIAITTNQGTLMLGNNPYAKALWHSAADSETCTG